MQKGRRYKFKVTFTFEGVVEISGAANVDQAEEWVKKHFGMTIDRGPHTTLPDENLSWGFPVHPVKKIEFQKQL